MAVARVRLQCTLCPWVDPLTASLSEDAIVIPVVCPRCEAAALRDRRAGDRRKLDRVGPWKVRPQAERRRKDRRRG